MTLLLAQHSDALTAKSCLFISAPSADQAPTTTLQSYICASDVIFLSPRHRLLHRSFPDYYSERQQPETVVEPEDYSKLRQASSYPIQPLRHQDSRTTMASTAPKIAAEEKFETPEVVDRKAQELVDLINKSKHLIAFTGAGISTSAGWCLDVD